MWRDYKEEITEDNQKFVVPLNRDTEHIYYNKKFPNEMPFRMIIDAPILTEPRTWRVTKVNRLNAYGLVMVTMAQDKYNQFTDYIEKDSKTNNVIGMWADYRDVNVEPIDIEETISPTYIHSEVAYSGTKAEIKAMGSYKKFTVKFYNKDNETSHRDGSWSFKIINPADNSFENGASLVSLKTSADSTDVEANQIKVKFDGDMSYVGKILEVIYTSDDGISSSICVDIKA